VLNPFDEFDEPAGPSGAATPAANPFDELDAAPPRSALGEIGSQLKAGALVEVPRTAGQALQYLSEPGDSIYETGKGWADAAEQRGALPEYQPHPDEHGSVVNALAGGARMIAPSVAGPALVGGALAALPVELPAAAGLGVAAGLGTLPAAFAQGQETLETLREQGIPEEDARAAARGTAAIEWGLETPGAYAGGKLFGIGARALSKAAPAGQAALTAATAPALVKPFVKQLGETALTEVGTEMGQGAGQAAVEQAYGGKGPSPWEAAKDAIAPTLGMTALLAPLGLAGFVSHNRAVEKRAGLLASAQTDPGARAEIASAIAQEIAPHDAAAAAAFHSNAMADIQAGAPINLGPSLLAPRAAGAAPGQVGAQPSAPSAPSAVSPVSPVSPPFDPAEVGLGDLDPEQQRHMSAIGAHDALAAKQIAQQGYVGFRSQEAAGEFQLLHPDYKWQKYGSGEIRFFPPEQPAPGAPTGVGVPPTDPKPASRRSRAPLSPLGAREADRARADIAAEQVRTAELAARGPLSRAAASAVSFSGPDLLSATAAPALGEAPGDQTPSGDMSPELAAAAPTLGAPPGDMSPEPGDRLGTLTAAADAGGVAGAPAATQSPAHSPTQSPEPDLLSATAAPALGHVHSPAESALDQAAHQAATSPQNDLPQPTEPQKEAGNYQKGHVRYAGLDISIENPRGSKRSGVDPNGKPWEVETGAHYGYVKRTEGKDGEQVDVYLASDREDTPAFVVDQVDPKTGRFDEHKVVLGAASREEAEGVYDTAFSDDSGPSRRQAITELPMEGFKAWLKEGNTKKPLAGQKLALATPPLPTAPTAPTTPTDIPIPPAGAPPGASQELSPAEVQSGLPREEQHHEDKQFLGGETPQGDRGVEQIDSRGQVDAAPAAGREARADGERPLLEGYPAADVAEQAGLAADEPRGYENRPNIVPPEKAQGAPTTATTPKGQAVDLRYALVEAADLVVSHDLEGTPNPAYPKYLQPRDRSRQASTLQIQRIAGNLAPERLGASPTVSDGAPVIGPDHTVESGNGRVLAIRKAYGGEKGKAYREYLGKNAAEFGLDPTAVEAMAAPVLVRTRSTAMSDAERAAFARDANESTTARMGPAEEARADAARIGTALEDYLPSEDGNVLAMQNRGFVKRFITGLAPEEAAALTTAEGAPTKQLGDRIRAAVFFAAYRDERLLALFAEEADPEIRNVIAALSRAAPEFARARGLSDTLGPYNVIPAIVEAADILREARRNNQAVEEAVAQQGLFGAQDPNAQAIALFMDQNKRSAKRLGEGLRAMAGFIEGELRKAGNLALFAETPPTLGEVIARVNQYIQERYGQENAIDQDLFSQPRRDAPVADPRAEGGKPDEGDRAGAEGAEEAKPAVTSEPAENETTNDGGLPVHGVAAAQSKPPEAAQADERGESEGVSGRHRGKLHLAGGAGDAGVAQRTAAESNDVSRSRGDLEEDASRDPGETVRRASGSSEPGGVAPETPAPAGVSAYGANNKIFTADAAAAARERLRKKLGTVRIGLDPGMYQDGLTLAGFHIEAGAREFAAFSKAMIKDLGEAARPYLRKWFNAVKDNQGFDFGAAATEPESIAESGARAERSEQEHRRRARAIFDSYPDGTVVFGWEKETIAGDVFWVKGERRTTNLQVEIGAEKASEFTGVDMFNPPDTTPKADELVAGTTPADKKAGREELYERGHVEGGSENVRRDRGEGAEGQEPEGARAAEDAGEAPAVSGEPGEAVRARVPAPDDGRRAKRPGETLPSEGAGGRGGQVTDTGSADQSARRAAQRAERAERAARELKGTNYRITPADAIGTGGWKTRARQNIEAIKIVKALTAEGRPATREEQAKLVKYVGWGASELANGMFENYGRFKPEWETLGKELAGLLTDEEMAAARASTLNAHYTSPAVIGGIYQALEQFGFKGGRILEPGAGIGHFIGLRPEGLAESTRYTAVELDPISAAIGKALYPREDVRGQDFADFTMPKGFFDVAIGNPPFADIKISKDPEYARFRYPLHDFMIVKSLDRVRPGGVMALVTSKGTMDKTNPAARIAIDKQADLIGAIRLPQTAFKENAGTEVVTDILFFRKRLPGEEKGGEAWGKSAEVKTPEGPTSVNEYYIAHPEMVLGKHSLQGTMYGPTQYTVLPRRGEDIDDAIRTAVARLPKNLYHETTTERPPEQALDADLNPGTPKENAYYLKDGVIHQRRSGVGVPQAKLSKKDADIIKRFVPLRDAGLKVLAVQMDRQSSDADLTAAQKELGRAYDAFVKDFGPVNQEIVRRFTDIKGVERETVRYPNQAPFRDDPDGFRVVSFEIFDRKTGKAKKAAIFTERVINPETAPGIEGPGDALHLTVADLGRVDIQRIAALSNLTEEEAIEQLGDAIYENPETRAWETAADYLSGPVRQKLKYAETAALAEPGYERNVAALKAAQPQDLPPSRIHIAFGAPFLRTGDIEEFGRELGVPVNASHAAAGELTTWVVEGRNNAEFSIAATSEWGTARYNAVRLLGAALNKRTVKVMDPGDTPGAAPVLNTEATEAANEKLTRIKEKFASWIFQDGERADHYVRAFNDTYNDSVKRDFGGPHIDFMTFPGLTSKITPHLHQKRVAYRIIQRGNTYMAHGVGAGKTIGSILAGMEMKRLGIKKKPAYVVPNHMLNQFAVEFLQLYPAAKILVADETSFGKEERNRFMGRIASENWDGIIITHAAFGKIPLSERYQTDFLNGFLDELRMMLAASDSRLKTKQIERAIERLEQRLALILSKATKDKGVSFEETGIDQLFVDEAQEFRKIDFITNMSDIKGVDPNGSMKAFDLMNKSRYLESLYPGRSLVLLSGTPITNTLGEAFSIQRLLQPEALKARGIDSFDAWASTFGDVVSELEPDPAGKYRMVTRFAQFVNVGQLSSMFGEVCDAVFTQDIKGLKLPKIKGGQRQTVLSEMSPLQLRYQDELDARLQAIKARKGLPQKGADIILTVIGDGQHAAIDQRFIDPSAPADPGSKIEQMIDKVVELWEKHKDARLTQMIFNDMGLPAAEEKRGFSSYNYIRKTLIARGIPAREIAFIQDYKQHDAKQKLFEAVNRGDVRVLIGSSQAMGTGVNAQRLLVALHHLDPDKYLPANMTQRQGRMVRQGNLNEEVEEYAYATKGPADEAMWGTMERKQRFIDDFLKGQVATDSTEDVDGGADLFALARALSSRDPRVMQLASLEGDLARLARLESSHHDDQVRLRQIIHGNKQDIAATERANAELEETIEAVTDTRGDKFRAEALGKTYKERKAAGEVLLAHAREAVEKAKKEGLPRAVNVGKVAGLPIRFGLSTFGWNKELNYAAHFSLKGKGSQETSIAALDEFGLKDKDPAQLLVDLEGRSRAFEGRLQNNEYSIAGQKKEIADAEARLGLPFEKAAELADTRRKVAELKRALDADTIRPPAEAEEETGADETAVDETAADTWTGEGGGPRYSRSRGARTGLYGGKIEKAQNLTAKERAVEARFAEKILADVEGAIAWYRKEWSNVVNTDNARDYSDDYNESLDSRSELAAAVHEPASWLVKQVWNRMLAEPKPADKINTVAFSAGGTGAGKTTAIDSIPSIARIVADAHIVYDSNMNDFEKAKGRIERSFNAGKRVEVFYVYRDPVEAMENGALPRAQREGRTVPLHEHAKTHIGAREVIPQLVEHYANDPRIRFTAIDNTHGKGGAVQAALDSLPQINDNQASLEAKLYATVKEARDAGRIREKVYIGTVGGYAGHRASRVLRGESRRVPSDAGQIPGQGTERQGQTGPPRLTPPQTTSRNQKPGPAGLSASGLLETLAKRFGAGVGLLNQADTLRIVQHESELPKHLNDGKGGIRAVYDGAETVWMVGDNLTAAETPGVFLHELGVHYGLERMIGSEKYQDIIRQMKAMEALGNKAVLAGRAAIPKSTRKAALDDELLAYLVEKHPELPIVKRIIAAIRAFLFRHGLIKNIRPEDVVALARAAARHAARGAVVERVGHVGHVGQSAHHAYSGSPLWYSEMAKFLDDKAPGKAPAAQWKSLLEGWAKQGKFKGDELEWSGVKEWLDLRIAGGVAYGPVTKDQVLGFVRENGVRVEETTLGARSTEHQRLLDEYARALNEDDDLDAADRASAELKRRGFTEAPGPAKFATWQLPGGENYREVLLRLPEREGPELRRRNQINDRLDAIAELPASETDHTTARGKEYLAEHDRLVAERKALKIPFPKEFKLGHYDEPNILAHVRFNERTDADGKRVLFIEELQSDWSAKGKKEGFADPTKVSKVPAAVQRLQEAKQWLRDVGLSWDGDVTAWTVITDVGERAVPVTPYQLESGGWVLRRPDGTKNPWSAEGPDQQYKTADAAWNDSYKGRYVVPMTAEQYNAYEELKKAHQGVNAAEVHEINERAIPSAPFVAKREFAVFKDGEEVQRTDKEGETHRQRYGNLEVAAKAAEKLGGEARDMGYGEDTEAWVALALKRMIRYGSANGFDRVAWTTGDQQIDRYKEALRQRVDEIKWHQSEVRPERTLVEARKDGRVVFEGDVDRGGVYGKGEFTSGPGSGKTLDEVLGKGIAEQILSAPQGKLEGEGLAIGGEGMRGFYDKIVPNVANALLKKLGGGRVGEVALNDPDPAQSGLHTRARPEEVMRFPSGWWGIRLADGQETGAYGSELQAMETLERQQETFDVGRPTIKQPGFDLTPELRASAMRGLPLFARRQGKAPGQADLFEPRTEAAPLSKTNALSPRAARVLDALRQAQGQHGYATFRRARGHVPDMSKADFDAGVLEMRERFGLYNAEREAIFSEHDSPLRAHSAEDAEHLVEDPKHKNISYGFQAVYSGMFLNALPREAQGERYSRAAQTETRAFRAWFGESKVVDEKGEPRVVYHGTGKDFSVFDKTKTERPGFGYGFHFIEDPALASYYAEQWQGGERQGVGENVVPVYLSIQNPFDGNYYMLMDRLGLASNAEMTKALQDMGYDGIRYVHDEMVPGKKNYAWVAFRPEQIKSAIGNVGTFDAANPDIRYSRAEPAPAQTETPAFRAWFGESKVVDEKGEPLVVYHGTDTEFSRFEPPGGNVYILGRAFPVDRPASFFTNDRAAAAAYGKRVMPVYLRITNPLDLTEGVWGSNDQRVQDLMQQQFGEGYGFVPADELWEALDSRDNVEALKAMGYDGVKMVEREADREVDVYAVFDPAQIKSATKNKGTFDPANPDIRYSRAEPAPDPNTPEGAAAAVDRIGEAMRAARRGGDAVKSKVLEDWRPGQLKLLTRRQVVEIGRDMVPELVDYDRGVQRMDADRTIFDGEAGEVATIAADFMLGLHEGSQTKTARGLKRVGAFAGAKAANKEADEVFDVMHAATLAGTDPAEAFRPGIHKQEAMAEMASLRRRMRTRPGEANILQAQIDDIQVRLDNEKVRKYAHPGLEKRYAALSDEAKNVYVKMRDLYMKRFDQRQEALIQRIRDAEEGEQWKARLIADIKHRYETARLSAPYFPLNRDGKLWVRAVNPDGEMEFHLRESVHQWKALREELTRAGYHEITYGKNLDDLAGEQGASAGFVSDVIKLLDKGTHMSNDARADLKDAIYQMYLETLPELSARRHWIHRHKVPGFSKDALRAFAKTMFHGNRQLALLRNQTAMDKALKAARNRVTRGFDPAHEPLITKLRDLRELKKKGDPELVALEQALAAARKSVKDNLESPRAEQLVDEMHKRHEWVKNPTIASWANNAGSLGFLWYLTAPASAIVNVTQTPLVAYPILAARHGWGKAGKALSAAMRDYFKGGFSVEGALQGERLAAYKRFLADGVIDKSRTLDLAGMSETPSAIYSGRAAKTAAVAGKMFHLAEVANREITALAAYDLARADGLDIEAAYEQAKEFTKDAHLDYSNSNKPPFLQHDVARVLLMFKLFSQGMYWLLGRSAHQSLKGLTPAARREARKRLTGMLGMHALFAGAMGMPLLGTLAMVMNALFDDDDEPWDFWTEIRNFLSDTFGPEIAQAIMRGPVESVTGLGISSRVSLGDLLIREPDPNLEGRGLVEWGIEQITGPLGGMALKAGTAYELWQDGNTRRALESMTPAPIRNGLQMLRYADEGVRSMRGDPLLEDVSAWNLFGQGLGFAPAELGQKHDANRALKDLEQRTLDRRERLINRWWLARRHGDLEGVQEAMAEIGRFNGSTIIRQNARARITPATLLASMQQRRNYSRRAEGGIIVDRRLSRLGERVRFGGSPPP
jgi:N12 class adenine-specific DNA methylase